MCVCSFRHASPLASPPPSRAPCRKNPHQRLARQGARERPPRAREGCAVGDGVWRSLQTALERSSRSPILASLLSSVPGPAPRAERTRRSARAARSRQRARSAHLRAVDQPNRTRGRRESAHTLERGQRGLRLLFLALRDAAAQQFGEPPPLTPLPSPFPPTPKHPPFRSPRSPCTWRATEAAASRLPSLSTGKRERKGEGERKRASCTASRAPLALGTRPALNSPLEPNKTPTTTKTPRPFEEPEEEAQDAKGCGSCCR
jgi:hypothetical protein